MGTDIFACLWSRSCRQSLQARHRFGLKSPTREGSVGARMPRLWCSPAPLSFRASPWAKAAPQTRFLPERPTFGKRVGREVLSQNIYIRTAPTLEAVFLKKASPVFRRVDNKSRINTFTVTQSHGNETNAVL